MWITTKDAPATKTEYAYVLRDLENTFGDFAITEDRLADYRGSLMRKVELGLIAIGTVAHRVTILKGFLKFARELGAHNLTDTALDLLLRRPRVQFMPPIVEPSDLELAQVLAACTSERDRLFILIANETGMRKSEICAIRMTDLSMHGNNPMITVHGKGRKQRTIPLTVRVVDAMTEFARANGIEAGSRAPLFQGRDGKPIESSTPGKRMREICDRAGVRKSITLHKFRHKCASEIFRGCKDANAVRLILGHESLHTTTRYIDHVRLSELAEAMNSRRSFG